MAAMASAVKRPAEQAATIEAGLQQSGQQITVMRAAEDLKELLSPKWTHYAISAGYYHPFNLQMPLRLPERARPESTWRNDSPISEMGKLMATLVGLAASGTSITKIICSPAFKCIQTAKWVIKGMGNEDMKINIEPGLVEWMGLYDRPPQFMTLAELRNANMPINEDYQPIMSNEVLMQCFFEAGSNFYDYGLRAYNDRGLRVVKEISARSDATEHVLLIAHASTLETIPRRLQGIRPPDNIEKGIRRMATAGNHYPPCAMVTFKQTSDKAWQRSDDIIPPFIDRCGNNTIDKDFYNGR